MSIVFITIVVRHLKTGARSSDELFILGALDGVVAARRYVKTVAVAYACRCRVSFAVIRNARVGRGKRNVVNVPDTYIGNTRRNNRTGYFSSPEIGITDDNHRRRIIDIASRRGLFQYARYNFDFVQTEPGIVRVPIYGISSRGREQVLCL